MRKDGQTGGLIAFLSFSEASNNQTICCVLYRRSQPMMREEEARESAKRK